VQKRASRSTPGAPLWQGDLIASFEAPPQMRLREDAALRRTFPLRLCLAAASATPAWPATTLGKRRGALSAACRRGGGEEICLWLRRRCRVDDAERAFAAIRTAPTGGQLEVEGEEADGLSAEVTRGDRTHAQSLFSVHAAPCHVNLAVNLRSLCTSYAHMSMQIFVEYWGSSGPNKASHSAINLK
jgi:hypothetical protein